MKPYRSGVVALCLTTLTIATPAYVRAAPDMPNVTPAAWTRASPADRALLRHEDALNETCQGGSGDDPGTQRACEARDQTVSQLQQRGWSYGMPGQIEADKQWRRAPAH